MASAEQPDLVAVFELPRRQPARAHQRVRPRLPRSGPAGRRLGRAQGEALHDALNAPVSPVIEEVGRSRVLSGMLRRVAFRRGRRERDGGDGRGSVLTVLDAARDGEAERFNRTGRAVARMPCGPVSERDIRCPYAGAGG